MDSNGQVKLSQLGTQPRDKHSISISGNAVDDTITPQTKAKELETSPSCEGTSEDMNDIKRPSLMVPRTTTMFHNHLQPTPLFAESKNQRLCHVPFAESLHKPTHRNLDLPPLCEHRDGPVGYDAGATAISIPGRKPGTGIFTKLISRVTNVIRRIGGINKTLYVDSIPNSLQLSDMNSCRADAECPNIEGLNTKRCPSRVNTFLKTSPSTSRLWHRLPDPAVIKLGMHAIWKISPVVISFTLLLIALVGALHLSSIACHIVSSYSLLHRDRTLTILSSLAVISSIGVSLSPLPVVYSSFIKFNPQAFPMILMICNVVASLVSFDYARRTINVPMLITNSLNIISQLTWLACYHYLTGKQTDPGNVVRWRRFVTQAFGGPFLLLYICTFFPVEVIGIIIISLNISLCLTPLGKIADVIARQSIDRIPWPILTAMVVQNIIWALYGYIVDFYVVYLPSVICFTILLFQALVVLSIAIKIPLLDLSVFRTHGVSSKASVVLSSSTISDTVRARVTAMPTMESPHEM